MAQESGFVSVWVSTTRDGSLLTEILESAENALGATDALLGVKLEGWRTSRRTLGAEVGASVGPLIAKVSRSRTQSRATPRSEVASDEA